MTARAHTNPADLRAVLVEYFAVRDAIKANWEATVAFRRSDEGPTGRREPP